MKNYDWYKYGIYEKDHYLSNNQYCKIIFARLLDTEEVIYEIGFFISDSKPEDYNTVFDLKSSGRCGLEGLIWAKRQIIKFEKLISKTGGGQLMCRWNNNDKRQKVYMYALDKIGFKYDENKNKLYKIII